MVKATWGTVTWVERMEVVEEDGMGWPLDAPVVYVSGIVTVRETDRMVLETEVETVGVGGATGTYALPMEGNVEASGVATGV